MDTIRQDIRYAVRTLRRSPGFTLVAVATLALGIGANTAIFSVVDAALLRPLPYPHPERLVRIFSATRQGGATGELSGPDFLDIRREAGGFAAVAATTRRSLTLTGAGDPERLAAEVVSPDYFRVLSVAPLLGRIFDPVSAGATGARQAVLSWGLWQTRFGGDPGILHGVLTLDGEAYAVVGVMPRRFQGEQKDTKLWTLQRADVPDSPFPARRGAEHDRGIRYLDVLARLRPGVALAQATAELDALATRLRATYAADAAVELRIWDWHEDLVGDSRRPLLLLLGAVAFVLLIACANLANLLLARGTARQREVTIRAALGASPARVARQFLTESVVLATLGGAVGVAVAHGALGPVKALVPSWAGEGVNPQSISIDGRVLLWALAVSLLAGLVAGVAPALTAARLEVSRGLREGSRGATEGAGRHRLRAAFVVAQVTLSLILLVSAGLLLRSFARLTATDPGFDHTRVLAVGLPLPTTRYSGPRVTLAYEQVLARVRALPGVQAAGAAFPLPLTGSKVTSSFVLDGRPAPGPGLHQQASLAWATPGYFSALRIPVRRGRLFGARDVRGSLRVAVVNEAMARRYWPGEDPIGRRLKLGTDPADTTSPWVTIVGVVADVRAGTLAEPPAPALYVPLSQNSWGLMALVVRTRADDPRRLVPALRRVVATVDPNLPLGDATTMDAVVASSVAEPRFRTVLLGAFAALALLLAAVGIYGVVAFTVTQRIPEIGIRLALGATPERLWRQVVTDALRPVLLGLVVGFPLALAAARILRALLYGVAPWDPTTFGAGFTVLIAAAVLASLLPARRAASVDPMAAIRSE